MRTLLEDVSPTLRIRELCLQTLIDWSPFFGGGSHTPLHFPSSPTVIANMSSGSLSRDMKIDTDPESLLRCLLSGERAIIDGPVQDTDPDSAMNEDTDEPEEIGRGKCGRVLRYDNCVLKSSHLDQHENLYNDFEMHTRVLKAFWKVKNTHHIDIHVPNIDHLSTTTDERHGHRLTLLTDYIHPMPYEVNEAMVKTIFPSLKDGIDKFLARSDNQHCLPRIHLGRRGFPHKDRVDDESLTLRDISLQLDELEQLRVNAYDLADTMGKALAVLHWKAGVNGAGVKFVLGQVPAAQAGAASVSMDRLSKGSPQNDTVERRIGLWLIDFDR